MTTDPSLAEGTSEPTEATRTTDPKAAAAAQPANEQRTTDPEAAPHPSGPTRWHHWHRDASAGHAVLQHDGVLYQAVWAPHTLADRVINDNGVPLPSLPVPGARGVKIDGDAVSALSDDEVARLAAPLSEAYWDALGPEHDAEDAARTAQAQASAAFLSLPVIDGAESNAAYHAKVPRSELEVAQLLAARGLPHVVQLLGRTSTQLLTAHAGTSLTDAFFGAPHLFADAAVRRSWVYDVARAVCGLHARGIVHRDLSTNNVVVDGHGRAVLVDLESDGTTGGYGPPEMSRPGFVFDMPADMFGFGMLLWSVQCKNMPRAFTSATMACEGDFAALMRRCTTFKPEDRPTAHEAVVEVERVLRAFGELE
ncbi:Serine/threonine-protein kinase pim-2 [Vanrija pseudolonga]|uniref:Serine/threonine-protein kinase pim-2 n=1 Tax=Vanrija pseudolonga TaxID=143232 RepID=A0AAF0Y4L4_9TREE|nr:Serine/threonine-protein kinase pim-2 [Vanrija pseudolonga]